VEGSKGKSLCSIMHVTATHEAGRKQKTPIQFIKDVPLTPKPHLPITPLKIRLHLYDIADKCRKEGGQRGRQAGRHAGK